MRKVLIFLNCLFLSSSIVAATKTANASANWNVSTTWSPAGVPAAGDDVIIPGTFTVTLSANMTTAIKSLTVNGNGRLNGNGKTFTATTTIIVNTNGTLNNVSSMNVNANISNSGTFAVTGNLTTSAGITNSGSSFTVGGNLLVKTFTNSGTATISGDFDYQSSATSGTIFTNSGSLTIGGDYTEDNHRYPAPAGLDLTYPSQLNSGTITFSGGGDMEVDGYFTNTGTITGLDNIHLDGVFCNSGSITMDKLEVHGGYVTCNGSWILNEIEFDQHDAQTGSDQRGVLNAGNFCTSGGSTPNLDDATSDGTVNLTVSYCGVALPVVLTEFAATHDGNTSALLTWNTSLEHHNAYFELERSMDGFNFQSIASIPGKGNSNQYSNYSYLDQQPANGVNYYRLKQVDRSGTFVYSYITSLNIGSNFDMRLVPNPASGNDFVIQIQNSSTPVLLVVYDINGNELFSKVYPMEINNVISVNDIQTTLVPGIYYIHSSNNSGMIKRKLIVY